ncbi:hypothetical protein [Kineosporia sp. NBRC 101731]|uniref:hypothetical protein n=1 Tax=Kineosporia sp. NBRC 101731 TaxID=3032199 RepID=UPI0024A1CC0B|nr:hypothetical protein [Kineosporia sp. NBRC 101731]GLY32035.1 hypothetical protein Kisp02_54000 [Kineosporia sp. NBRC 101731]
MDNDCDRKMVREARLPDRLPVVERENFPFRPTRLREQIVDGVYRAEFTGPMVVEGRECTGLARWASDDSSLGEIPSTVRAFLVGESAMRNWLAGVMAP